MDLKRIGLILLVGLGMGLYGCGEGGAGRPVEVDYASFTTNANDIGGNRGALRGRVTNGNHQPLAHVEVTISNARRQAGSSFTTRTKADGTFEIGNVETATYQLSFSKTGFQPMAFDVFVPVAVIVELPDTILQPLAPGQAMSGTVTLDAGVYTGVDAMATVTVTDADLNTDANSRQTVTVKAQSATTDPTGETIALTETGNNTGVFTGTFGFERPFGSTQATPITPGNGKVGVYAEATVTREAITVVYHDELNADLQAMDVTTTATYEEPYSTVSGVIRDQVSGQPIAGAAVVLFDRNDQRVDEAVSRSDGSYAFYGVPDGVYTLVAKRQGFVVLTRPGVVVGLGLHTTGSVSFDAAVYTGVDAIGTVQVRDADLNLARTRRDTVRVNVRSQATDPTGETLTLTETAEDTGVFEGTFGFERPFDSTQATPIIPDNGKVGVYAEATVIQEEIRVTYHDMADAQGQMADVSDTALYQEPPSTLSGVVRSGGQTVAGAAVLLFDAQNRRVGEAVSRSDGSYAFYNVPDGVYTLTALRAGFQILTQAGIRIGTP